MTEDVVRVDGLTKRFRSVEAVRDLSFSVQRGQVYGLLGPNGAGKTSALRMLLGLDRPTAGSAYLFGTRVTSGCPELFRVGAIIEDAAFVPHLSGLRNLRLWWEAAGTRFAEADVDGALAVAGLRDAVHRKVGTYSQGMKQRLGFARALLGRPELLVLDEPTNGLDPGEIREIRDLIGRVTAGGATVLFSSHHLAEVEQVCTHAVVMQRGRLVADGPVRDLVGNAGAVYLEVSDRAAGQALLERLPAVTSVVRQGDGLVVEQSSGGRADLAAALVGAGIGVETLTATRGLEDAFLDLLDRAP